MRAGLRLVDEVDALPGVGGVSLEVRVGVNTGEALVRLDMDPAQGEGFLTGDAVNVAARLEAAAPPMAVAVGAATHSATAHVFSFDECHPVAVKGKSQPVKAWIATAPKARTASELRSFATSSWGGRKSSAPSRHCSGVPSRWTRPKSSSSLVNPASVRAGCSPSSRVAWRTRSRSSPGDRDAVCRSAPTSPSGRSRRSCAAAPASWRATVSHGQRLASKWSCPRPETQIVFALDYARSWASRPKRLPGRRTSRPGARSSRCRRHRGPPCWSSRTCTGLTSRCSRSSTT